MPSHHRHLRINQNDQKNKQQTKVFFRILQHEETNFTNPRNLVEKHLQKEAEKDQSERNGVGTGIGRGSPMECRKEGITD